VSPRKLSKEACGGELNDDTLCDVQRWRFSLTAAVCLALPLSVMFAGPKGGSIVYAGTYTGQGSEGIYAWRFDPATGSLTPMGLVAKSANPSFLAIAPGGKHLYAVGEIANFGGARAGAITAFAIDARTGKLSELNQVSSRGAGPCFVAVDKSNHAVLAANYGSGSVVSFRIEDGGRLSEAVSFVQHTGSGENKARQQGPHAHSINVSPDGRFAIAADLGTDELRVYRLNAAAGTLTPQDPPALKLAPGDGPRHFAFHPNGRVAYVINELHSTITGLHWDASRGVLQPFDTVSTLPADFKGDNTTAEVQVHPSGKWVYGSNRGLDSIAVFAVDRSSGKLRLIENVPSGGAMPRNFRMDPTGRWLLAANQRGNNIVVFRIDQKTGRLTPAG